MNEKTSELPQAMRNDFGSMCETILELAHDRAQFRAERDALKTDAALGALVRRMPVRTMLYHAPDGMFTTNSAEKPVPMAYDTPDEALADLEAPGV